MRYTAFGHRAGLRVSECALGTANFGTGWGTGAEPDEARRIFDRFAEAGGTFLDSADSYLAALDVQLTDEQYARLGKVGAMPLGVPHEGVAGSLGLLQGGDGSSVIAPVVPVA
ncbi:aldo/keto reductase [Streptomyces erythrochromogenes]|uniref:aldo/keto reductase n=1 Tax=Streptomyces erythrochromogenes TaxID=285574 RepID=UPI0004CD1F4D